MSAGICAAELNKTPDRVTGAADVQHAGAGTTAARCQQPSGLKRLFNRCDIVFYGPQVQLPACLAGAEKGVLRARVGIVRRANRTRVESQPASLALLPGNVNMPGDQHLFRDFRENAGKRADGVRGFEKLQPPQICDHALIPIWN